MKYLDAPPGQPFFKRASVLFLLVATAGCQRDEIKVYTVPKEKSGEVVAQGANQPALGYVLPDGWKEEAAPAEGMSVLNIAVPGSGNGNAEVKIMQFPGKGVPTLELINVVRQDAGLPAISEQELNRDIEPVAVGSDKGSLINLNRAITASATNASVLLAVYAQGEATWFFKLNGDPATVAAQKPAFIQFLKSISFTEADEPLLDTHKGMGTNAKLPSRATSGAEPEGVLPDWKVPAGWQEMPLSQMAISAGLKAKFGVSGKDGTKAEINIGVAGGDVLMNLNRWRVQQLGLPPAQQADIPSLVKNLDVQGAQAMLVDMTGTDAKTGQKARMVGVIVPQSAVTWFFKLMGDENVVESQKAVLVDFVKTVNYSHVP